VPPFARIYDRRTESGQALVIVLIVALLLITTLVAALASARAGLAQSNGYTAEAQGEMAAQTGLATELTAMRNASTYGALPCDLTGALGVTEATSSYAVVVTYSAAGTQLACPPTVGTTLGGITAPTNATLTASGKAPHGITAVMREDLGIVVNSSTSAALGYAIFTENSVNLVDAATLQTGTATPDIYAGGQVTCANGTASTGNLVTQYAQGIVLSGTCSFGGNLTSAGPVNMQGSALVTGNVISYGGNTAGTSCSGGSPYYSICLSGNPLIVGNATETNGSIEVPNGRIAGNAYATGTISITNGGTLGGTKNPNDSALSSQTMPAVIAFPAITLPSTGWNIVSIPNSSYTCATYFANIDNEDSGSRVVFPDPFQSALENQNTRTVYEAPTCGTPASPVTYQNSQVFALNPSPQGDAILEIGAVSFQSSNTFCQESSANSYACSSAGTAGPNLTILAGQPSTCSTSSLDASFSGYVDFESNIATLVYSPGEVSYSNSSAMTGQILACGGLSDSNSFTLLFNSAAATEVIGSSGASLSLTTQDKYIATG